MHDIDAVYKSPEANLEVMSDLPGTFIEGSFSTGKLKFLGWLSLFYLLFSFPTIGMDIMTGLEPENTTYDMLATLFTLISMIVWVYLLMSLKTLLNLRFEFFQANTYIHLLIVLSVISTLVSVLMENSLNASDEATIGFFASILFIGIISILLGVRLLRIKTRYYGMKLYAWCSILSGISMASIFLLLLAIPFGLLMDIALAVIFFTAANELSNANTSGT